MRNLLLVSMVLAIVLCAEVPLRAQESLGQVSESALADGERLFRVHCARCHGIDGKGGEGSNLARSRLKYAPDDSALVRVIGSGIPGTGMPDVWSLDEGQIIKVAAYVRSLGKLVPEKMPGDPDRGMKIYQSKGGCPACHIIAGQGNGVGPELTEVGDQRGLDYLTMSLTAPAAAQSQTGGYQNYLTVRLTSKNGQIEGLRINEDAFSIQVRDVSGTVHSFRKEDLLEFEKIFAHSLMPEYGAVLSGSDMDDLVSYLMSLRSKQ